MVRVAPTVVRVGASAATLGPVVSVGSNSFLGVEFPVAFGDRYVHIGRDPSGVSMPEVRVLRWDAETKTVQEEVDAGDSAVLTWDQDEHLGAVRLRVNPERASTISGYLAGGPLDAMTVVVAPEVVRVVVGNETVSEFAGNVLAGSEVGLHIDPATGSAGLGAQLPAGFEYRLRYQSKTIRLGSMVDVESPLLRNREFTDCRVEGPVLLAPVGSFGLERNRMGAPGVDPGSLVWEIPPTGQAFGALMVSNVVFRGCELLAVGFAVAPGHRDGLLRQLFGQ